MRYDNAVVDASVSLKWVLDEDLSDVAETLLDVALQAPDFWLLECGNVLWVRVRRKQLTRDEAAARQAVLAESPVRLVPTSEVADLSFRLASELDERIYDCAYLALALQRNVPFVTADRRFARRVREEAHLAKHIVDLADL